MKSLLILIVTLFTLITVYPLTCLAAEVMPSKIVQEGTDFWLSFQKNYKSVENNNTRTENPDGTVNYSVNLNKPTNNPSDSLTLKLFIASSKDARVKIEIAGLNYTKEVTVKADSLVTVDIDFQAEVKTYFQPVNMGIHVTSDNPVTIYGLNSRKQTTDTFTALPVESLGTEYMVMSYFVSDGLMPHFAIVATEDNTEVNIKPSCPVSMPGAPGQGKITVKLNKGEVYQVESRETTTSNHDDLSGSIITSNKKIAVFGGHQCAYVPEKMIACNHLVEQMPPVEEWGKAYYAGKLAKRNRSTIRVIAWSDNTEVRFNSMLVATLNSGEVYEESQIDGNIYIKATKPVLVSQYSHGFKDGDMTGDPMMMLLRPVESYNKSYRVATPMQGSWHHFINVSLPAGSEKTLKIDGKPVDVSHFAPAGDGQFLTAQIEITYGAHLVECDEPFGICSYGFGYDKDAFDAYGNM